MRWKDIPGYEGLYQISDKGDMRSLHEDQVVAIRDEYAQGTITAARLAKKYGIAETTITPILRHDSWCHLRGTDYTTALRKNQVMSSAKLTKQQVRKIRKLHEQEGWTAAELATEFKVSRANMYHIVNYRTWRIADVESMKNDDQ